MRTTSEHPSTHIKENLFTHKLVEDEFWDLFARAIKTRKITVADREILQAVFFNAETNTEVFEVVDRICWFLRRGHLQMVD